MRFPTIVSLSGLLPVAVMMMLAVKPVMPEASDGDVLGSLTDQTGGVVSGAKKAL